MSWMLFIAVGLAGLVTALMHLPGVWLYDWVASRTRGSRPAVREAIPDTKREPLTQTG